MYLVIALIRRVETVVIDKVYQINNTIDLDVHSTKDVSKKYKVKNVSSNVFIGNLCEMFLSSLCGVVNNDASMLDYIDVIEMFNYTKKGYINSR